jgi:hypothetical protein
MSFFFIKIKEFHTLQLAKCQVVNKAPNQLTSQNIDLFSWNTLYMRFKDLSAMTMKITAVFWDVMPHGL